MASFADKKHEGEIRKGHQSYLSSVVKQALEECSGESGEPIIARNVYRMSKEGMFRVSWRVTVSFKDKERALSGESWPEGWGVRRFNGSIRDDQKSAAPFQPQGTTTASPPGAAPPITSS